jgi:presenilin-like A22 family membrane protease
MKHNVKITIILLVMFFITQFIGLYVVNHYADFKIIDGEIQNVSAPSLPYGIDTPQVEKETDFYSLFPSLIIAFIIAISLIFVLNKFRADFFLKLWFFVVIVIALGISLNAFLPEFKYVSYITLAIAGVLGYFKIYRGNFLIHNLTELFVYPGIAAIFVPILNVWTIIALLVLISIYDMWAVWHSGIMQKMAKYQMDNLKIFSGFFVPYLSKKQREKIKKMKKSKSKKKGKIKANVAILGGGDVIFPIITGGVMLKTFGWTSAIMVVIGAGIGLSYLLFLAEKKKFYPAMPFISAGIFAAMILYALIF